MPIEINPSLWKSKPFAHQIEGVRKLVANKAFALFDEMGAGKSKQVIDAACTLAASGEISTVIIVCPASVRTVWCDADFGEIRKHTWVSSRVIEFCAGKLKQRWSDDAPKVQWCVTNYEILRSDKHLQFLIGQLKLSKSDGSHKAMLVCDESSYIKSRTAKQTKAVKKLRAHCDRCVILNGTPIHNNPGDLWSQMNVLAPKGAEKRDKVYCSVFTENWWRFRARYAVMGGFRAKQIVKWINLEDISKSVAPYVLRRLKQDCLDLSPKLFTEREVALSNESWKRYKLLREECVVALGTDNDGRTDYRIEPNGAVRLMRLAELTSGHLGGDVHIQDNGIEGYGNGGTITFTGVVGGVMGPTDYSSEKLDWCVKYLTEECTAKYVIVWTRWRRERERLAEMLFLQGQRWDKTSRIFQVYGGQSQKERDEAVANFSGVGTPARWKSTAPTVLIAQPHAGGMGLNLIAATEVIYLSNDFSYGVRLQSEDRCHRPGQIHPVTYIDVLATGPTGQKTIDHTVFKALHAKEEIASYTCGMWRKELKDE